jgi:hypothetical protein
LEWLITDRVEHLWKEECKEESLRNVLLASSDACETTLQLSDGSSTTKTLSAALAVSHSNKNKPFRELIASLKDDRIFLRLTDVTSFILDTKTDKRNAIASIIGYDAIVDFRNIVKSTSTALEKDGKYLTAKGRVDDANRSLLASAGQFITTREKLYEHMTAKVDGYEIQLKIIDNETFNSALAELRNKTNHADRFEKKVLLDQALQKLKSLQEAVPRLKEKAKFIKGYNELVLEKSTLDQIHLQAFLTSGVKIIDGGHVEVGKCPFCQTEYDLAELRSEVDLRLKAIAHIASHLEQHSASAQSLFSELANLKGACGELGLQLKKVEGADELCAVLLKVTADIIALHQDQMARFRDYEDLAIPDSLLSELDNAGKLSNDCAAKIEVELQKLEFTAYENQIIDLIEHLQGVDREFSTYEENSRIVSLFQSQILSLGDVFDEFVKIQNAALQNVLNKISKDVGLFYQTLHPDENIDSIKLKIIGEEGVEFEYLFHGKPAFPPRKYLSESHLNSLGLVFFLASAKLFNKSSRFLVLDDIVTSLDSAHRRRLLRLLKQFFSDWQIILLTHEAFWFEMIKKELGPDGWLLKEMTWDETNGAQIDNSAKDIRDLIELKRKKGVDVSNDLRKLTEATLKELAFALEVKMAFRYNEQNEQRMTGELLSELRSTVNRKSSALKGHQVFANLDASSLIATVGSHDNSKSIVGADIDVALADIDELNKLFECADCNHYVTARNSVAGEGAISCKCGKHKIDWK